QAPPLLLPLPPRIKLAHFLAQTGAAKHGHSDHSGNKPDDDAQSDSDDQRRRVVHGDPLDVVRLRSEDGRISASDGDIPSPARSGYREVSPSFLRHAREKRFALSLSAGDRTSAERGSGLVVGRSAHGRLLWPFPAGADGGPCASLAELGCFAAS